MKKTIKFLLVLAVLFPMMIFADGNGPGVSPKLKVKIINEDGWLVEADLGPVDELDENIKKDVYIISKDEFFEHLKKLPCYDKYASEEAYISEDEEEGLYLYYPKGTVIDYETMRMDDIIYDGYYEGNSHILFTCSNSIFDDLQPASDKYDVTEDDVEGYSKKQTMKVINEKGAQIYTGPAYNYKKLDIIPFNTDLQVKYYVNEWIYVTYNDVNGWVYKGDVVTKYNEKAIIGGDIILYNVNNKEDQKKLNKNTEINEYYFMDARFEEQKMYYFKDDYYGTSDNFGLDASETDPFTDEVSETRIRTKSNTPMYNENFLTYILSDEFCDKDNCIKEENKYTDGKKIGSIPSEKELVCKYTSSGYNLGFNLDAYTCYVDYNGKKGWIYYIDPEYDTLGGNWISDFETIYDEEEPEEKNISFKRITFKNDKAKLNDKVYFDIELIGDYDKFDSGRINIDEYYFDIKYDEKDGYYFVLENYDYIKPNTYTVDSLYLVFDNNGYTMYISDDGNDQIEIYSGNIEEENIIDDENDNKNELSITEIIILCSIGVAIIALSAYVTILLINRKKPNKNEIKN